MDSTPQFRGGSGRQVHRERRLQPQHRLPGAIFAGELPVCAPGPAVDDPDRDQPVDSVPELGGASLPAHHRHLLLRTCVSSIETGASRLREGHVQIGGIGHQDRPAGALLRDSDHFLDLRHYLMCVVFWYKCPGPTDLYNKNELDPCPPQQVGPRQGEPPAPFARPQETELRGGAPRPQDRPGSGHPGACAGGRARPGGRTGRGAVPDQVRQAASKQAGDWVRTAPS